MASLRTSSRRIATSLGAQASRQPRCSSYATAAAPSTTDFQTSSAGGIKTASIEDRSAATGAITVAIKAGSRYESQPGLAHVLKNFVFKNTNKRSALRLVRETELLGGVLSTTLGRENLYLTAEFVKGDEGYFAEVLGDVLTSSKFAAHEYNEDVIPSVAMEYQQAESQPEVLAMDFAHQLAFRRGLGNSLFATPHLHVDLLSAVSYARSAFSNQAGLAVVSSGIGNGALNGFVNDFFKGSSASSSLSSSAAVKSDSGKSHYYGGEMRVPHTVHGGSQQGQLLIGFQGGAVSQPEYAVLRSLLGGESSLKWSPGASPLSQISTKMGTLPSKPAVRAFNLAYSDAGLFGFFISAPTDKVKDVASQAVSALKEIAKGAKEEEVKRAIAQSKFAAATALENRLSAHELVATQLLAGNDFSLQNTMSALDGVTAAKVAEAAKAALKSKATVVAVGDTHKLPWADELSL